MKLIYEATLEDAAEPAVRQFLRSKTASSAKIRSTVIGAVCAAAVVLIFFRDRPPVVFGISASIVAVFGGFVNYLAYAPSATSRIKKYIGRETEGRLPATTTFWFEDYKIFCDFLGSTITFPLSALEQVTEDGERLEMSFGKVGICTIPLRAFSSPEQKTAFLESLTPND